MAITKILAKSMRLDRLIAYVCNPAKTSERVFVSCIGCERETAAKTWMETKRRYGKTDGIQAYHLIQSFRPDELTPELAHEIGNRFAEEYLDGYEVIVGTHTDRHHIHNHIIFNSVSDRDGTKYHSSRQTYFNEIRTLSDRLCREYGISTVDEPQRKALTYIEWRMQKCGVKTQRELFDRDAEECLSLAMDVGSFYARMEDRGYTVRHGSKYPTFLPYGGERAYRVKQKGESMTEDNLAAYIDGAMSDPTFEVIMPRQKPVYVPRGKITGIHALILAWMHILGLINDGVKTQYYVSPKELKRFTQLKEQEKYLRNHGIETAEQLKDRIETIDGGIAALTKKRTILNVKKKREKPLYDALWLTAMYADRDTEAFPLTEEERKKLEKSFDILRKKPVDILNTERNTLYAELAEVNRDIRAIKNERRLCERILVESPQIEKQLQPYMTAEREMRKDYLNYESER
ncbi:MAG: relaxase/mobilization nuclease domain-containing protein [Clostridia bacterium]|nr:relaxase/mobilization nuclease domain-containing protein [Clostridia bacterium]